ncbi:MAG: hypothetical protein VW454_07305 [Pelagibacteraceae bacterium]
MRFKVKTLVDVTETNAPRGTDDLLVKQQQNFNTFYNVITKAHTGYGKLIS